LPQRSPRAKSKDPYNREIAESSACGRVLATAGHDLCGKKTYYESVERNIEGNRTVRKSTLFIFFTSINIILIIVLMLHSWIRLRTIESFLRPCTDLAGELQLTDLCLFTEARYTRNLSMADLHAAFQDHPMALEHFPSGSLVTPPRVHFEAP
jgi:hypothetical protein